MFEIYSLSLGGTRQSERQQKKLMSILGFSWTYIFIWWIVTKYLSFRRRKTYERAGKIERSFLFLLSSSFSVFCMMFVYRNRSKQKTFPEFPLTLGVFPFHHQHFRSSLSLNFLSCLKRCSLHFPRKHSTPLSLMITKKSIKREKKVWDSLSPSLGNSSDCGHKWFFIHPIN